MLSEYLLQLKAVIVDDDLRIIHEATVVFDTDLPEFRTHGGIVQNRMNPSVVTVPTLLWVKSLDILMDRLLVAGVDFSTISAISGTAQVRYFQKLIYRYLVKKISKITTNYVV